MSWWAFHATFLLGIGLAFIADAIRPQAHRTGLALFSGITLIALAVGIIVERTSS